MGIPLTLLIYCIGTSNANRQIARKDTAHEVGRAAKRCCLGSKQQADRPVASGHIDGKTCVAQL
jgi:hypothetical protein